MWFQATLESSRLLNRCHRSPVCLTMFVLFFSACNQASKPSTPQRQQNNTKSPTTATTTTDQSNVPPLQITSYVSPSIPNPGYVGPQACAECHKDRVAECLPTSHFRTCRPPDLSTLPRGFLPDNGRFKRSGDQIEFETMKRGKDLIQATLEPSANGIRRIESTIDLIYGANPISDEVYLSWRRDGSMWELPIAWVYATDCWGASGFDRDAMGDRSRQLTLRCFECHNTWFQHVPGTANVYRREDIIMGVTCERCHGPGKEHVSFHREHPSEKKSHGILFPGGLPRERLIEVCTQCHCNAIRHKGPALSYRPGEELEKHYRTVEPPHTEDDHVANQIGNLRKSKCFLQSEMTCITCHDPHLTASPVGSQFQDNCLSCHTSTACPEQPRLPLGVREKCVECHMRKYVKVNVNFDLAEDSYVPPIRRSQHLISIDPVATHEVLLNYFSKSNEASQAVRDHKAWLVEHWATEAKNNELQQRFMASIAALRESLQIDPDNTTTRVEVRRMAEKQSQFDSLLARGKRLMAENQDTQAIETFQRLLQMKPSLAEAHGRLGTLFAKAGNLDRARESLHRSIQLDPDDQYGHSMLARLALVSGDLDSAINHYRDADAIEPYNSKIHLLWAQVLIKAGRQSESVEHFRISAQIDPKQIEAHRALCDLLAADGKLAEALLHARRLCELTSYQGLRELMMLAEIHVGLGETMSAASVANHAISIAKRTNPSAADEISKWLQENSIKP